MKTDFLRRTLVIIGTALLFTCSSSDDSENPIVEPPQSEGNYVTYSVTGSAVNNTFSIAESDSTESNSVIILGHVYDEDTPEGTMQVASLGFSRSETEDNHIEIYMTVPNSIGAFALGEIETGSTGLITEEPLFNMKLSFGENAFYDSDGDSDNDLITNLLSKSVSVTVTEYEEVTNSLGILTVGHIKGSFEGQAYFKAFTGPTSDPEVLLHSITGSFEYTLQTQ